MCSAVSHPIHLLPGRHDSKSVPSASRADSAPAASACSSEQQSDGIDLVAHPSMTTTAQHPTLTLSWAVHSLELALRNLEDGPAERRVRRQFHQLVLAIERHSLLTDDAAPGEPFARGPRQTA